MAFKVINKIFKGELVQVTPCKGYGYIRPLWNIEGSGDNLYCYYASDTEKARKQCFLKIFEKGGKYSSHEVRHNFRNEEIWIPENPQTLYFMIEIEGPSVRCVNLYDTRHLSQELKEEAEKDSFVKPDLNALLKEQGGRETEEKASRGKLDDDCEALKEAENSYEDDRGDLEEVVTESPYDEGYACGERDAQEGVGRQTYDLDDLSWADQEEFERGYENGFNAAQDAFYEDSWAEAYSDGWEEPREKAPKVKKDLDNLSVKAAEKAASKKKKQSKKALQEEGGDWEED